MRKNTYFKMGTMNRVNGNDRLACCICGKKVIRAMAHDPYPIREESWYHQYRNRCCTNCNAQIVVPIRLTLGRDGGGHHEEFKKMNYEELMQLFETA